MKHQSKDLHWLTQDHCKTIF